MRRRLFDDPTDTGEPRHLLAGVLSPALHGQVRQEGAQVIRIQSFDRPAIQTGLEWAHQAGYA